MDVAEKRLTKAVKENETFLGDFLGLDVNGADGWNLSCAGVWFKGELRRIGIDDPIASNIEKMFVRYAGSVLANAPKLREKFAALKPNGEAEVSSNENQ